MPDTVNLREWRATRRRGCWHFWLLLFIGLWLVTLMLIATGWQSGKQRQAWQALLRVSNHSLLQALEQREPQLRAEHQQWLAAAKRKQQRETTQRWQSTLATLASRMPEQAWLTELQWQGDTFALSGLSRRFIALSALDDALRQLPGFLSVTPGAIKQDEQGRWQFSYQLKAGESYVSSR